MQMFVETASSTRLGPTQVVKGGAIKSFLRDTGLTAVDYGSPASAASRLFYVKHTGFNDMNVRAILNQLAIL